MGGNIDLLLPGLFDLPAEDPEPRVRLPGLERMLRFGRPLVNRAFTIDANIAEMLRLPGSDGDFRGLPVAPSISGESGGGVVLFEPVHLRPDMQQAIVLPVGRAPADVDDTRRLVRGLASEFGDDFDCDEIAPAVYLMRLRGLRAPEGYPHLLSMLGKPANPLVERDRGGLAWYRLLTEIQMYLHRHAVNDERLARGAVPINSLWFWGAGEAAANPGRRPAWLCDDPVLREFARSLGLECRALESGIGSGGDTVAIDLRLLEWLKTGVERELGPLLRDIDSRLLQPSLELVRRRRMTLRLRGASEFDLRLGPWSLRCFWRRRRYDITGLRA